MRSSEETAPGGFIHGKTSWAISGRPDIPCFLLLDNTADEPFLSVGLGADSNHRLRSFNGGDGQLKFSQNLLPLSVIFFLVY